VPIVLPAKRRSTEQGHGQTTTADEANRPGGHVPEIRRRPADREEQASKNSFARETEETTACHKNLAIDRASTGFVKRRCITGPAFANCAPHWDLMDSLPFKRRKRRQRIMAVPRFPSPRVRVVLNGVGNSIDGFAHVARTQRCQLAGYGRTDLYRNSCGFFFNEQARASQSEEEFRISPRLATNFSASLIERETLPMNRLHSPKTETRWYLAVRCEKCESPIMFALDHTEGGRDNPPAAKLVLTCAGDTCRHRADYTAAAILRFQK
jgi:hypothetical protein